MLLSLRVLQFVAVAEMVDYCCSKPSALAFHGGLRQELKFWYNATNIRTRSVITNSNPTCNIVHLIMTSIYHPLWVKPPLIKGFTEHQAEFGQQLMSSNVITKAVVGHIIDRRSGQIVQPRHLRLGRSLRAFPRWLQEPIRSLFFGVVRRVSEVRSKE